LSGKSGAEARESKEAPKVVNACEKEAAEEKLSARNVLRSTFKSAASNPPALPVKQSPDLSKKPSLTKSASSPPTNRTRSIAVCSTTEDEFMRSSAQYLSSRNMGAEIHSVFQSQITPSVRRRANAARLGSFSTLEIDVVSDSESDNFRPSTSNREIQSTRTTQQSKNEVELPFPKSDLFLLQCSDSEQFDILRATLLAHQSDWLQRMQVLQDQCKVWQKLTMTSVTWDNPQHEEKLFAIFKAVRPDLKKPGRLDKAWGKLGFQGKDPITDFRGMGMLGVEFLYYLGHQQADLAIYLFQRKMPPESYYPLACSCINLLCLALEFLNLNKVANTKSFYEQTALFRVLCSVETCVEAEGSKGCIPLFNLVCRLALKVDATWIATDASYMHYPALLRMLRVRLALHLENEVYSINELIRRIEGDMELKEFRRHNEMYQK